MGRLIKIVIGIVVVFFLLIFLLPFAFSGKVESLVRAEAEELLDGHFSFEKISISMTRSFPFATVKLENIILSSSTAGYTQDTLLRADNMEFDIDLKRLYSNEGIFIRGIYVKSPAIWVEKDREGNNNWSIFKSKCAELRNRNNIKGSDEDDLRLQLKNLEIADGSLTWFNQVSSRTHQLEGFSIDLRGRMYGGPSTVSLGMEGNIQELDALLDYHFMSQGELLFDMSQDKISMKKTRFEVNHLNLTLQGALALQKDDQLNIDLSIHEPNTSVKSLFSLFPYFDMKAYTEIEEGGSASLKGWAKGVWSRQELPAFNIQASCEGGMLKQDTAKMALREINLDISLGSHGALSPVYFNLNRASYILADENLFFMTSIDDLLAKGAFSVRGSGVLDFTHLAQTGLLIDDLPTSGRLEGDISLTGVRDDLVKRKYDDLKAKGNLLIKNLPLDVDDEQVAFIQNTRVIQEGNETKVSDAVMSRNGYDMLLTGSFSNLLPFLIANDTLQGNLSMHSSYFVLGAPKIESDSITKLHKRQYNQSPFRRINMEVDFEINQLEYDQIPVLQLEGKAHSKSGLIYFDGVSFEIFGGTAQLVGVYDPESDIHSDLSWSLKIEDALFGSTFSPSKNLRNLFNSFRHKSGRYDLIVKGKMDLQHNSSPILSTLKAKGEIRGRDVVVQEAPFFNQLAQLLRDSTYQVARVDQFDVDFQIADETVVIKPTRLMVGDRSLELMLQGRNEFSGKMSYHGSVRVIEGPYLKGQLIPFLIRGDIQDMKVMFDTSTLPKEPKKSS